MRLGDHLDIIYSSVLVQVIMDDNVIYRGYKGNAIAAPEVIALRDKEVSKFTVKVEISNRKAPQDDILPITELNCGQYNYCDLRVRLFYTYILEK